MLGHSRLPNAVVADNLIPLDHVNGFLLIRTHDDHDGGGFHFLPWHRVDATIIIIGGHMRYRRRGHRARISSQHLDITKSSRYHRCTCLFSNFVYTRSLVYDISVIRRNGRVRVESDSEQVVDAPDTCPIITASGVVCVAARVVYAYSGGRRDVIVKMKRLRIIWYKTGAGYIFSFICRPGEQ